MALRFRQGVMGPASVIPTQSHRHFETDAHRNDGSLATAIAFVSTVAISIFVGLLSLTEQSIAIPSWVNEPHAQCARVQRLGDAALAYVAIGTPPHLVKLLVRLDAVVEADTASTSTVIFADELLRSETLRCDGTRHCTDVALLTDSTTGKQERSYVEFEYGNAASAQWWVEYFLKADGAMRLVRGWTYALTRTHFCWASNSEVVYEALGTTPIHALEARMDNVSSKLITTRADVEAADDDDDSPFFQAPAAVCNETIELFPAAASAEQNWLALSSGSLYESVTSKLDARRDLVERGLSCADPSGQVEIYSMDCALDPYADCRSEPSIPFRRLSRYALDIRPRAYNDTISIRANFDVALSRISGSMTLSQTIFFAAVRLCVLLIVAFVVYSRAERQTASAFHTIDSALDVAVGKEKKGFHTRLSTITDAAVGVMAVISRLAVLVFQSTVLIADGHSDAVVIESIGVFVSVLHFGLRNLVLETDLRKESPIQKLGGSMALADAANAALFSVISTPTLQVSTRDFDAVARLFVGVLIAVFVLHRCYFSVASCTLLASTTATDKRFDPAYSIVLWTAALLWSIQVVCVIFSFGRFFVVSQAYSIHRNFVGEVFLTESCVFFSFLAVGSPLINAVLVKLAKSRL